MALNTRCPRRERWNLPGFEIAALFSGDARQAYEDKYAPQRSLNQIVNRVENAGVRVAYFGPAYAANLEGTPYFAMGYNPGFQDATAQAATGQQLLDVFRDQGLDYVITPLSLTTPGTPLGEALAGGAQQLAVVNGAGLYRLRH